VKTKFCQLLERAFSFLNRFLCADYPLQLRQIAITNSNLLYTYCAHVIGRGPLSIYKFKCTSISAVLIERLARHKIMDYDVG